MVASQPNRAIGGADRRMSGSPRLRRRPPARGVRRCARDTASSACSTITKEIAVSARKPSAPHAAEGSVWELRDTWNRATENLSLGMDRQTF